jgi:hypothetical protein
MAVVVIVSVCPHVTEVSFCVADSTTLVTANTGVAVGAGLRVAVGAGTLIFTYTWENKAPFSARNLQ